MKISGVKRKISCYTEVTELDWNVIWIIVLLVFVAAEALTYQLVTIWFAIGALGALACALAHCPLYMQFAVFAALSLILLCIIRPVSMRYIRKKGIKTNADSLIGGEVLVTETVNNTRGRGRGRINGMEWSLRSVKGDMIKAGEIGVVRKIEGVKLIVERKEEK